MIVVRSHVLIRHGQVARFVQVAQDDLCRGTQFRPQRHRSKLPEQVVAQRLRARQKVLKRGRIHIFKGAAARTETGVQVVLKVAAKVDFVERILFRPLGFRHLLLSGKFAVPVASGQFIKACGALVDLLEDGVLHHLGVDHLLQFQLVEREYAHHLHQARRQHLPLRNTEIQLGLQQQCEDTSKTAAAQGNERTIRLKFTPQANHVERVWHTTCYQRMSVGSIPGMARSEPEAFAQVDPLHLRIPAQFTRRAMPKDAAFCHDVRAVGHVQRLAHVVIRNQHADAAGLQ